MSSIGNYEHHSHHHHHHRKKKLGVFSILLIVVSAIFFVFITFAVFFSDRLSDIQTEMEMILGIKDNGKDRHVMMDYDGIDVSHHQGKIDWERVADDARLEFVYIKATEGSTIVDSRYDENFNGAKDAGLHVGSYHFFSSSSTVTSQFANFKQHVSRNRQDIIPMVDVEKRGVRGWSKKQLRDSLALFVTLVESYYGKSPIIYSYSSFYNDNLAPYFNSYHLFLARYNGQSPVIEGDGHHNIWQHSDCGLIDGITTDVDLDMFEPGTSLKDILMK
jgi:lysozyme